MSLESEIHDLSQQLVDKLIAEGKTFSTAESCTGGLIGKSITDIAGSSQAYDRGFITYSNNAKMDHLGVEGTTLEEFGAVSEEIAKEMALGARSTSGTNFAISTTGIAGPDGGTNTKPVGLVYIGITDGLITKASKYIFEGDRNTIRLQATKQAIINSLDLL